MRAIGIDIGGTKMRGLLWNGKRVLRSRQKPTPGTKREFQQTLKALVDLLRRGEAVGGLGIGAAGIVEKKVLAASPNIPYIRNFDFRAVCLRDIALEVDNDARAFARAEFLRGAARGSRSLFALTIGTGIGRAFGRNRKIIRIKKFEYPEKWEKEYQRIRDAGDFKRLSRYLAERLAVLIAPYNPETVVVGGGVTERPGFLADLSAQMKTLGLQSPIRRATLGQNAVALGAALLCFPRSMH